MRKFAIPLVVIFCLGVDYDARPRTTNTQSIFPAANQSYYLDLDTAEGAYSQWRHDDLSSLDGMSATIRVPMLRKDRKWLPAFFIWLQDAGIGDEHRRVGIKLTAPDRKAPLELSIVQTENGKVVSSETLKTTVGLDEDLPIEMTWATPYTVTIKVGVQETRNISVTWQVDALGVSASTGQMKVEQLVLGKVGR